MTGDIILRLSKLEIYGFKSFAQRVELRFDSNLTGIVGPNGSGKSNIADAVRWVMGEQSPKSLRGGKMEDVIFGGTQKRRPLSYCEVSLTFDNADHTLDLDFTEVMVTRRLFRSGESEYLINKTACRLKDIVELFRGTGAGKEGYSIIGQGRVDELLSNRAEDRRQVFEEAAGISKFKARKEEAQRRLGHTHENLDRVADILGELEDQLEPLRLQGEVANHYVALREELKELEITVFANDYERLGTRIEQLDSQMADAQLQAHQTQEQLEAAMEHYQQAHAQMEQWNQKDSQLSARAIDAATQSERLEGQARVLEERHAFLQRDQERLYQQARLNLEQAQTLSLEQDQREQAEQALRRQIEQKRALVMQQSQQQAERAKTLSLREQSLEEAKQSMIASMNRLSDVKARVSRLQGMETGFQERIGEIRQLQLKAGGNLEDKKAQYEQARHSCLSIEREYAEKSNLLSRHQTQLQALDAQNQEQQKAIERIRREKAAIRSRMAVLEDMKRDYEGYAHSVKRLLQDCRDHAALGSGVHGVLAELLDVPKHLDTAIEMALGPALQHIVTDDEQDAKRLIEHLRNRQYGRATMLPISAVKGRVLNNHERGVLDMPGSVGIASSLIGFDGRFAQIVDNLLGRTVLAEDMETAIEMARRYHHAFRIVTISGDIIHAGGSMSGGSQRAQSSSLLGRERQIQQMAGEIEALVAQQQQMQEQLEKTLSERAVMQDQIALLNQQLTAVNASLSGERERMHILSELTQSADVDRVRLVEEQARLEESLQDTLLELEKLHGQQDDQQRDDQLSQQDIAHLSQAFSAFKQEAAALDEALIQERLELQRLENTLESLQREYQDKIALSQSMRELAAREQEQARQAGEQAELIARQREEALAQLLKGRQQLEAVQQEREQAAQERQRIATEQSAAKNAQEQAQQALLDQAEVRHRMDINKQRAQDERESISSRIWEEYALTYATAKQLAGDKKPAAGAKGRIEAIRDEIRAMGTVNVGALEEYQRIQERCAFLHEQRDDLLRASEDLLHTIAQLDEQMERCFQEKFIQINERFTRIFAELFGGGTAQLSLQQPDDVLHSGVDISAQPPGKKLQNISLLSGGERALTAIAILFAMLETNPSPFCILDEIEAALDEANVIRFATFLSDHSRRSQFLVVTHRKGTMECCQELYGVSMEEKGVSSMVSVRLS